MCVLYSKTSFSKTHIEIGCQCYIHDKKLMLPLVFAVDSFLVWR